MRHSVLKVDFMSLLNSTLCAYMDLQKLRFGTEKLIKTKKLKICSRCLGSGT